MPVGLILFAFAAAAPSVASQAPQPAAELRQLVQSCEAHRFETVVTVTSDGKPHPSKVKLCGTPGQSDQAWLHTLKDAVAKTAANEQMPASVRQQIVRALTEEIVRLSSAAPATAPLAAVPPAPVAGPSFALPAPAPALPGLPPRGPQQPFSRDYATYAPLPLKNPAEIQATTPTRTFAKVPLLALRCGTPGDDARAGACDTIDRDTAIVVRADAAFPRGAEIRFIRSGKVRAEVRLPAMRSGQIATLRLPAGVCSGVVRSRVDVQAVSGAEPQGTPAGSLGQFDLRC